MVGALQASGLSISYDIWNEPDISIFWARGMCLDVLGAGSNLGQQFDQWACKNGPGNNQDFTAS